MMTSKTGGIANISRDMMDGDYEYSGLGGGDLKGPSGLFSYHLQLHARHIEFSKAKLLEFFLPFDSTCIFCMAF